MVNRSPWGNSTTGKSSTSDGWGESSNNMEWEESKPNNNWGSPKTVDVLSTKEGMKSSLSQNNKEAKGLNKITPP